MKYISMTDLRTKTPSLRESLEKGEETYLVHRSKIIGVIKPLHDQENPKKATIADLSTLVQKLGTAKHYSYEEREKLYREKLEEKYGTVS